MTCRRAAELDLAAFVVDRMAAEWSSFRGHYPHCGSCAREVASWTRLMNTIRDETPGSSVEHPAEERLLQFQTARASLSVLEQQAIDQHLRACAPCRTELKLLQTFNFGRLRAAEPKLAPRLLPRLVVLVRESFVLSLPRPVLALAATLLIGLPVAWVAWNQQGVPESGAVVVAQEPPTPPPLVQHEVEPSPPALEVAEVPAPKPVVETPEKVVAPIEPPPREQLAHVEKPSLPPVEAPKAAEVPSALVAGPAIELAALMPNEAPTYMPPYANAPTLRSTGVIRGLSGAAPSVQALGPDHTGIVFEASPRLYWRLSENTRLRVELIVNDPRAVQPLVDIALPDGASAGIHVFDLAALGVKLAPGVAYEWSVALVPNIDDRSLDAPSMAGVKYVPPSAELSARIASAPPAQLAHVYAESGSWYEAFDQLSRWVAQDPDAEILRRHRAALLAQAGIAPTPAAAGSR